MIRSGIPVVQAEVALPHELEAFAVLPVLRHGNLSQRGLHLAPGENLQAVGVQAVQKVLVQPVGVGVCEEVGVHPYLGIHGGFTVHPVDGGALHFVAVGRVAALAVGLILAENFGNVAVFVLHTAGAGDEIGTLEAHLVARIETFVFGRRNLFKVLTLHIEGAGEGDLSRAGGFILRVVFHGDGFALPLGIVGDGQFDRIEHCHNALCVVVQILAQAALQQGPVHGGVIFRHADSLAEIADASGGIASSAKAAECGHAGIIPSGDIAVLHQLTQLALAHHGVIDAEAGKLDLSGFVVGDGNIAHHPVIQGAVCLIFQGAEGVGDALQRVLNRVGKVIHGEDAPFRTLTVVLDITDAVEHGVAHVEVAAGQVNFGTQGIAALFKLAVAHAPEEIQVFLNRSVTPGRDCRMGGVAPVFTELLRGKLTHVCQALLNQLNGVFIGFLKIV